MIDVHFHRIMKYASPVDSKAQAVPSVPTVGNRHAAALDRRSAGARARQLADLLGNSPQATAQRALRNGIHDSALMTAQRARMPIQRKISFEVGAQNTFTDIDHLKRMLKAIFAEAHHDEIDRLVDAAENLNGRPIGAVSVFNQIRGIAGRDAWTRIVAVMPTSTTHGPVLPSRDTHDIKEDKKQAMSTFTFSTVTLGRATVTLPNGKIVSFEGRNDTDSGDHAEDVLMRRIDAYLKQSGIDASRCRVRITLNNAPCGTGHDEKNCAGNLAAYNKAHGFAHFRVYFVNPYGKDMAGSVRRMQAGKKGIKVGSFTPKDMGLKKKDYKPETWKKIQSKERFMADGYELDAVSESDSESDSSSSSSKSSSDSDGSSRRHRRGRRAGSSRRSPSPRGKTKRSDKTDGKSEKSEKSRGKRRRSRSRSPEARVSQLSGPELDNERLFEDTAIDLLRGPVALTGYQVGRLIAIFGGNPVGKYVHINGVELRIRAGQPPLPKTSYNPDGLSLWLVRHLRGG